MKTKPFYILIILTLLNFSCSSDDENNSITEQIQVIESFDATSIKFMSENGVEIQVGECLDPSLDYAIQIETVKNNLGNTAVSRVEYTVNGVLFSMSFSQEGIKSNPIIFVEGINRAELVKTASSTEIFHILQDDFLLVE